MEEQDELVLITTRAAVGVYRAFEEARKTRSLGGDAMRLGSHRADRLNEILTEYHAWLKSALGSERLIFISFEWKWWVAKGSVLHYTGPDVTYGVAPGGVLNRDGAVATFTRAGVVMLLDKNLECAPSTTSSSS